MYFCRMQLSITLLKYNIHTGKYKNPKCTWKLFHRVGSLL